MFIDSRSAEDIKSFFTTEELKIFTDIVFVDSAQRLIVKTWQKVHFNQDAFLTAKTMVGASPDMARAKSGSNRRTQFASKGKTTNIENFSALKKLQTAAEANVRRNTVSSPENRE